MFFHLPRIWVDEQLKIHYVYCVKKKLYFSRFCQDVVLACLAAEAEEHRPRAGDPLWRLAVGVCGKVKLADTAAGWSEF